MLLIWMEAEMTPGSCAQLAQSLVPLPCTVINLPHPKIRGDSLLCCWHSWGCRHVALGMGTVSFLVCPSCHGYPGNLQEERAVPLEGSAITPTDFILGVQTDGKAEPD